MKPDWEPSNFMMDAADGEIAAVGTVFPQSVKIFLCHWHVLRSLKKQLFIKVCLPFACILHDNDLSCHFGSVVRVQKIKGHPRCCCRWHTRPALSPCSETS